MRRFFSSFAFLTALTCVLAATGCRKHAEEASHTFDLDGFMPVYNRYITKWLHDQVAGTTAQISTNNAALATAQGDAMTTLEIKAKSLQRDLDKWSFRLSLGDYFKIGDPKDIPGDLVWKDGMDQQEVGDPKAQKGGALRRYFEMMSFPPTIRPIGENASSGFRGDLYDFIDIPLINRHPGTMKDIPGVAREWATSADGRTVFMRLDPEATYSNGERVKARDIHTAIYVHVSDNLVDPYPKQFFRETYAQVTTYGDDILAVTLPEAQVDATGTVGTLVPYSEKFYAEYGPDYKDRYQWRFPPTTGAYEVKPADIVKGVSITQSRVKNWWAKDRKYYRYRFNPDKLVHVLVRDESKAFELFRAGELDSFIMSIPQVWYEKSEIPPIYDGYIERTTCYNRYPKFPRGFYLNTIKPPLNDKKVRIGISQAMNFQKVIEVLFRGDYTRLNAFNAGFGIYSDPSIRARPYSIESARASFREAGYTTEGKDGILMKPDGTRLSAAASYQSYPLADQIFAILAEDAKACGFELRLDGLEGAVFWKKFSQKQTEMAMANFHTTPPTPAFYEYLHSSAAFDDKGSPKPDTNNYFCWARPDTDILCDQSRNARTEEELRDACWKLQRIMHDEALFIPNYAVEFKRIGTWRWVRWPDTETTRFAPPLVSEPHEAFVYWIDEDMHRETLDAIREGKKFPEVNRVADAYREQPSPSTP